MARTVFFDQSSIIEGTVDADGTIRVRRIGNMRQTKITDIQLLEAVSIALEGVTVSRRNAGRPSIDLENLSDELTAILEEETTAKQK